MAQRFPFDRLAHCTHWTEAGVMVEKDADEGKFLVKFVPNSVSAHHQLLANYLADYKVFWFGIIPNPEEAYIAPDHGAHPAFNEGSRYGPFSFEINVNTVFEKYRELSAVERFENLNFYRVTEKIYPKECSNIVVVSAAVIADLDAFKLDSAPCIRQETADGGIEWEWECEGFDEYQSNETQNYFQLEFLFVFAEHEGAFPDFTFSVGRAAHDEIECVAKSNPHETASICIPFQNRWDDTRKSLTCIMVANPNGERSGVRRRPYDQALKRHKVSRYDGWGGVNRAICEAGGCNNPSARNGVQTKAFADEKLAGIFA